MKTHKKSPLPSNLKSIPKGFVYLGKGGEFKTLPKDSPFKGYCMASNNTFNESLSEGTVVKGWRGTSGYYYFFAPADSKIARLNGLSPRKRKVAPKPAPKVRYFTKCDGFSDGTIYLRHEGDGKNVMCVSKDGSEGRAPHIDLTFALDACKRGVFKEISKDEALAMIPKPAPVTITDLWEAFKAYAATKGHSLDALLLCKDGSGRVLDLHDKHLMQFDNLPEALHKIKSATK